MNVMLNNKYSFRTRSTMATWAGATNGSNCAQHQMIVTVWIYAAHNIFLITWLDLLACNDADRAI